MQVFAPFSDPRFALGTPGGWPTSLAGALTYCEAQLTSAMRSDPHAPIPYRDHLGVTLAGVVRSYYAPLYATAAFDVTRRIDHIAATLSGLNRTLISANKAAEALEIDGFHLLHAASSVLVRWDGNPAVDRTLAALGVDPSALGGDVNDEEAVDAAFGLTPHTPVEAGGLLHKLMDFHWRRATTQRAIVKWLERLIGLRDAERDPHDVSTIAAQLLPGFDGRAAYHVSLLGRCARLTVDAVIAQMKPSSRMTRDERVRYIDHLNLHRPAETRLRAELKEAKRRLTREEKAERRHCFKSQQKPCVADVYLSLMQCIAADTLGPPLPVPEPRSRMAVFIKNLGLTIDLMAQRLVDDIAVLDSAMQDSKGATAPWPHGLYDQQHRAGIQP